MKVKHPTDPSRPRRNNNTVDLIVATCVRFLRWIQENIFLDKIIVGTQDQNPNIILTKKTVNDRRGNLTISYKFHFLPPKSTQEPKKPIARSLRNDLWTAVSKMSDPANQSRYYANRFEPAELISELNYLKKRRELFLELLEATGARPGELARVLVSENCECTVTGKFIIATLKRRNDRSRKFPIDPGVAIKIEIFIHKTREVLLERLKKKGVDVDPQDRLFLCSKKGTPLSEQSLTKEFQRIVIEAGINEEQACASMFRHRFITNMVKIHLQSFLADNQGTTKLLMTEADYRTILKRVAVFTDHADENSLWHYIDLAWDELGVFDYVEPARRLASSVERSLNTLTSLQGDIKLKKKLPVTQILENIIVELESIRADVKDALKTQAAFLRSQGKILQI